MAKEWILNSAMNRFQLNFKRNVGPTSESIRQCVGDIKEIKYDPSQKIGRFVKWFFLTPRCGLLYDLGSETV